MTQRTSRDAARKALPRRRLRVPVGVLGLALAAAGTVPLAAPAAAIPANAPKTGMVCTVPTTPNTYNLVAGAGYIETPDGNSVYMWSYANADAPDSGHFQSPGPVLCVTQGAAVTVHLHNTLPEVASVVFPGQEGVTTSGGTPGLLTAEAAPGGDVTYTFTAADAGTYLYESGSDPAKQLEMGLAGALVVRPATGAGFAYDAGTAFDPGREYLLLLGEIDPDLHHAVELASQPSPPNPLPVYDVNALHNRYFAINGREFPDTVQDNGSALLPNQPYGALVRIQPNTATNTLPALIRMINVGADNHPFHPHGNHTRLIAQDGRLLTSPAGGRASTEHFGETIGSGQTEDFLLRWDDTDLWSPANPLPVSQPNYRDLTFKDGNTFYSGSPYLGYRGTLPTGTVSQNVCGEWYFPLHSHALNEFTNFDQGFGGMGTLLRVDPPGGCFAAPSSTKILAGTLSSGSVTNLAAAGDGKYYMLNSTTTGATRSTDWYGQFSSVPTGSTSLSATYTGRNCTTNNAVTCTALAAPQPTTTLQAWNWTTSAWVALTAVTPPGTVTIGAAAVTMTGTVPAPQSQYIGTGATNGQVRVRVLSSRTAATGFVTQADLMKLTYTAP
jgi:FtsP/CotA-like multicopper oxidase with cupredoxin domain